MTVDKQPEALRLADWLDHMMNGTLNYNSVPKAAAELRRLHAENEDYGASIGYLTSENAEHLYCDASWWDGHAENWQSVDIKLSEGGDPYAATRRAIVRAAAEIGRSMK